MARIVILEKRIKWLEAYPRGSNKADDNNGIKQQKKELAEAKIDKLRSIPFYSSRMTGYPFVCSACWDKVYWLNQNKERKKKT